ncbi:DEAD/DEAH box helicase [bacterium]|nr:DEAD/DEAH box helicase [bacterium]
MIELRKGITTKHASCEKLIVILRKMNLNGLLYIGYPIFASAGERLTIDALLISKETGIIIFNLIEGSQINTPIWDIHDRLYMKMSAFLMQHTELNVNRKLAIDISVATFAPVVSNNEGFDELLTNESDFVSYIKEHSEWRNNELFEAGLSVLQSVIRLREQKDRSNVRKDDSRGAKLINLEKTIANLDRDQEKAVIEFFDGIQRIRGLAGSGKTIVLALKAAYLHSQYPSWNIAVTFHTRALKNQFAKLIERFCYEKTNEPPNWKKVHILQAWGSSKNEGIYYNFCSVHNIKYFNYQSGLELKVKNQSNRAVFDELCSVAINSVEEPAEMYDAILIDEAQDLPESFLQMCYKILKKPRRLVYAYDELQKLNKGTSLRNPKEIFGEKAEDTILKKCYRNSRPTLITAHSLGLGIYRDSGLVQFFDEPQLWIDLGYKVKKGKLEAGSKVQLYRDHDSSPNYLEHHSQIDDILIFKSFDTLKDQAEWVAKMICKDINDQELLFNDIIVINTNSKTTKDDVAPIRTLLWEKGIQSHIAGEYDADVFFENNSVTFTGIFRAKGNEVPMVYIINAHNCYSGRYINDLDLIKSRNILFTAITRAKAWVRITGIGDKMESLVEEYERIQDASHELHFDYPRNEEINQLNIIHRDVSNEEKLKLKNDMSTLEGFKSIIMRLKLGEVYLSDFPKEEQEILKKFIENEEGSN